ncbi:MAG: DUF2357 domain-containing protein [Bacteroidia bacterium]|nr:DUF2357 domain-containing protein [Bacteroidia bacterium]
MLQFQSLDIGFLQIRANRPEKKLNISGVAESVRFSFRGMDLSQISSLQDLQNQPLFFEWQQVDIFFEPRVNSRFQPPYRVLLNGQETGLESALAGNSHKLFGSLSLADAVGFTDIEIRDSFHRQVFILETEVFPIKLSYKSEFDAMMEEIHSMVHLLGFDHLKKTFAFTAPTQKKNNTLPEWLALLSVLFEGMEKGLDMILRSPNTQVKTSVMPLLAHRIKHSPLKKTGKWLGKNPQYLSRHPENGVPLAPGRFATHLPENRKTISTDTPENRFVLQAVKQIIQTLEQRINRHRHLHRHSLKIQQENEQLLYYQQRLIARIKHPLLANIPQTTQPTPHSLVLTRAPGYRDFYQKYLLLQHGLSINNNDIFRLHYKEISTLYEYWCFLKMIQILRDDPRYEVATRDVIQINHNGLSLTLKKGKTSRVRIIRKDTGEKITLWFNRSFGAAETHTFAQIPDHIIEFEKAGYRQRFRYILDAKYRLDLSADIAGPPPDSIAQLHRYRDAILSQKQVSLTGTTAHKSLGGVILFPFPGDEEGFRQHRFFRSRKEVNIGAIPFLPGKSQTHTLFREFLDELFETPPEVLYEQMVEYERSDHQRVIAEAGTRVMIGVVPDDKNYRERLDFFAANALFHTLWRAQPEDVAYIALYDQRQKKIIAYGRVESRIIVWAAELEKIGANWPRRFPQRKYIVYRLEKMIACDLSFRGMRKFGMRYTSLWGLKQAIRRDEDQYLWLESYAWLRLWQETRQIDTEAEISFFRDGQGKRQVEMRFQYEGQTYTCTLTEEEEIVLKGGKQGIARARLKAGIILQMLREKS